MALKISELVAGLNKVMAAVGDAPVVFKQVEQDVETVLHTIGIELAPTGEATSSVITLHHGDAPAESAPAAADAEASNPPTEAPAAQS